MLGISQNGTWENLGYMFLELNDHRFGGRGIAFIGSAVQGNKDIGLRKIGGTAFFGDIVRQNNEFPCYAFRIVVEIIKVYQIPFLELKSFNILGVHQDNTAFIKYAPISIVQPVNSRVKLIMAPYGHH